MTSPDGQQSPQQAPANDANDAPSAHPHALLRVATLADVEAISALRRSLDEPKFTADDARCLLYTSDAADE